MTITATPSVTTLPEAPQRLTDTPAQFVTKADDFVEALDTYGTELQAVGVAAELNGQAAETAAAAAESSASAADSAAEAVLGAAGYIKPSASSLSLTNGTKALVLNLAGDPNPALFAVNDEVHVVRRSNSGQRLIGSITAWDGVDTGTLNVPANGVVGADIGTGPYTDWLVVLGVFTGSGASDEEVKAGTSAFVAMTPANMDVINGNAIAFAIAL